MVCRSKVECVFLGGIIPLVLVVAMDAVMMPVLTMKVLCQAVIAAVQKFKLNATMPVKTYNSSTKAAAKREETGSDQKPNHRFFK